MSSNKTANYQLNQWEPQDQVLRADFNADNAKLDAALKALSDADAALGQSMARLGNCQIYYDTYIGDGSNPNVLTFPAPPMFVYLAQPGSIMYMSFIRGMDQAVTSTAHSTNSGRIEWSGNSVRVINSNEAPSLQFNASGDRYLVLALLDMAQG